MTIGDNPGRRDRGRTGGGRTAFRSLRVAFARSEPRAIGRVTWLARAKYSRGWPTATIARSMGIDPVAIAAIVRGPADLAPRLVKRNGVI